MILVLELMEIKKITEMAINYQAFQIKIDSNIFGITDFLLLRPSQRGYATKFL